MQRRLVAEEHIRRGYQALQHFGVASVVVIERDRALISVRRQEVRGLPAHKWRAPSARLISGAGALDLDYVGAQITEQHRAIRSGERLGQFDYANSFKNGLHVGRL